MQLVNDALGARPHARDGREQGLGGRAARARRRLPRRRRRRDRAHAEDARRDAADPRAGRPARADRRVHRRPSPTWSRASTRSPTSLELSSELEALTRHIQTTFSTIIEGVPYLPEELQIAVANVDDPEALGHMIAGSLRIKVEEKQALLEEANVTKRLRRLSEILARELEVMELGSKIQSEVQSEMDKTQREYFLREQLKAIQRELGEEDETQAEINELREQIEEAGLPEDVRKQAERELSRLEKLPPAAAEHGVIRTYLEWILDLPWNKCDRGQPRHRARAQGPRRRSLRHREGQGPDPRPPRGAQAEARRTGLDPVASSGLPASARPRSASRSPRRSGASSSASRSAACATRPRSAATAAPTSARCRARSSGRCATRSRTTPCS